MKIFGVAILLGFSLFTVNAMAARPGYTYAGAGYAIHYLDGGCDQDGLSLDGSLSLDGQVFFQASHTNVTGDGCGSTRTTGAVGLRNDYGQSSSAYAKATLIFQRNNGDLDPGVSVTGGLRTMYTPQFEINVSLTAEIMDDSDQNYITGGVNYKLFKSFGVLADLSVSDDGTTGVLLGGRYSF